MMPVRLEPAAPWSRVKHSTTEPLYSPSHLEAHFKYQGVTGKLFSAQCDVDRPFYQLNRESYMSAHVLLNLLNEFGKSDIRRGLPSILSLFRNEFNKFNNTRARMLDSTYHMTNTLKSHFWRKNVIILPLCTQRCFGRHNVSRKSINH